MAGGGNQGAVDMKEALVSSQVQVEHEAYDCSKYTCTSCLGCCLCMVAFTSSCCNCVTVNQGEEVVYLHQGKYFGRIMDPGLYYVNPMLMETYRVSIRKQVVHLTTIKVLDLNGNPLEISGVVTFQLSDTRRAILDVQNYYNFIKDQASCVLKVVAGRYPYEAPGHAPSLKSEVAHIKAEMRDALQKKVMVTGATIESFELTDLSYSPEIAQAMLARQQAEATVSARETIVKGAVTIATGAIDGLEATGVQLTREEKARLVGNLLIVICGEARSERTKVDLQD